MTDKATLDVPAHPEGVKARETSWLIERKFVGPTIGSTGTRWYVESDSGWHSWTHLAHEAKRFASKAEADAFPPYRMIAADPAISVTEHVFISTSPEVKA